MIKIIFSFLLFLFLIPYTYSASYQCPYIENDVECESENNTCDGWLSNNSRCKYYSWETSTLSWSSCELINENCTFIEEPEWYIRFLNWSTWEVINTVVWVASNTPLWSWETWEAFSNEFINRNIQVELICTNCNPQKKETKIVTENSAWIINLIDENWNELSKKYRVWKIDKTPPVIEDIVYNPSNDVWSNWPKTATLVWRDDESWLIWESSPSFTCSTTWWCSWLELSITDSAWNISTETFSIWKIDKQPPTVDIFLFAEIENWKQKVGITCNDSWWSWCNGYNTQQIEWIDTWVTQTKCVYDYAWNSWCKTFSTSNSEADFSDIGLPWTNWTRYIYLDCIDNHPWVVNSWCEQSRVDNTIYNNTDSTLLTVRDNAWNTVTKEFEIFRIDKIKPTITINSPDEYKASDDSRINISVVDNESWVFEVSYNIWSSCKSWNSLIWTNISNWWNVIYNTSWTYTIYACATDIAWNINEASQEFTVYPWDLNQDNSSISIISTWYKYANNTDYYTYSLNLKDKYDNYIYDKSINEVSFNYLYWNNRIYLDEVSGIWDIATEIFEYNNPTNSSWDTSFKVKSYTPWDFSQKFKIKMNNWWDDYNNNTSFSEIELNISDINSFLKPIKWSISIDWYDYPEIWVDQEYKIDLTDIWSLQSISNWKLNISSSSITNTISWHFWDEFKDIDNDFWNNLSNYIWFLWLIWANDNVLKTPKLSSDKIEISYEINWKVIRYYLDDFNSWNSCDLETLWLKVIWNIQWGGKLDITWQEENFSDLSKFNLRTSIRKNAYTLIRNMNSWDILNWVRYIDWNINLSWDIYWYETLIVTNWNVFISGDLNTSWNKLWIIVLKDNYDVLSDYNNIWNIYISDGVENINAIIYADWTLRSANQNGDIYNDINLNKQLKLKWSLFTRNTIGWAVKANNNYLLPGWKETTNFDLAEIYDLNYVRKVATDCSSWVDNYSFIIEYDNSVLIDPPKWFSN